MKRILLTTAALALLTACGSATGPHRQASARSAAVAMSQCMRSHGVPNFPDPDSSGNINKAQIIPLSRSPQFQVAQKACGHLLPSTNEPKSTHAEVEAALRGMVRFASCMRSDGVQGWPDPTVDTSHPGDPRPVFDLPNANINPHSPRLRTDIGGCAHVMPLGTTPYMCSRALAEQIPGSPPGAEACDGGSATVP